MHVVAIEYEPSSKRGGQELSYFDVLTGLKTRGHSITLVYVLDGDLLKEYQKLDIRTIQIPRISISNKLNLKEWIEFIISCWCIKDIKGATIYINQLAELPLSAVLKKLKRVKKIVCHLRLPPLGDFLSKKFNQVSLSMPLVSEFIVANKNMFDAHTSNGVPKIKTYIIPNGFYFNTIYNRKKIDSGELKLVYIGRFDVNKGIRELIEIMPSLLKLWPTAILTIAGHPMNQDEEKYINQCKKIAKGLNIDHSLVFPGHQAKPIEFLKDFDITIFPSIWDEPFGRVLVESVMAGTPVIARDTGVTMEILDNNIDWVYQKSEDLVNKIKRLVDDPAQYPLSNILRNQKELYSIKKVVRKIEQVLE